MTQEVEKDPMARIADALERIANVMEAVADGDMVPMVSIRELSDCIIEDGGQNKDESALRIFDASRE